MKYPVVLAHTQLTPHELDVHLVVPAELRYFSGHFPEAAVLPGVVQVEWALHYAALWLGVQAEFCGLESLKFRRPIQPHAALHLRLVHVVERARLRFEYSSTQGSCSCGTVLFRR